MDKSNVFIICFFVIIIAVILGINIVSMIDKKISTVSVNIPPINLPKSTIIINLDKNKKIKAEIDPNTGKTEKVEIIEDNIKGANYDDYKKTNSKQTEPKPSNFSF